MRWTEEEVQEMHRDYEAGDTLAEIGQRHDVTREAIRQQFIKRGLARRGVIQSHTRSREAREYAALDQRERIIELYKEHGTIKAVMAEVALPRRLVAAIVDEIPNRETYRRQGTHWTYGREDLIDTLQRAAKYSGEPLTIQGYRKAAKALGLPSYDTQVRYFYLEEPDEPWLAALEAAGLMASKPVRRRANVTTLDQCVKAVARCITESGGDRVPYLAYDEWASARKGEVPSGATIRSVIAWNTVVELALEQLA